MDANRHLHLISTDLRSDFSREGYKEMDVSKLKVTGESRAWWGGFDGRGDGEGREGPTKMSSTLPSLLGSSARMSLLLVLGSLTDDSSTRSLIQS